MKKCPFCAEDIQEAAVVCKHCGHSVVPSRWRSRAKILIGGIVLLFAIFLVWIAIDSTRPPLLATVHIEPQKVSITNLTESTWSSATVNIADGIDMPSIKTYDLRPGETIELKLADFQRKISGQAFNPAVERNRQFTIEVPGFQLGMYR